MSSLCCLFASRIASKNDWGSFVAAELKIASNALETARCPILASPNSSGRGQPKSIVVGRKEGVVPWLLYRYRGIKSATLAASPSPNEADSIDASMEDDAMESCDDVTFRTCARSLTDRRK